MSLYPIQGWDIIVLGKRRSVNQVVENAGEKKASRGYNFMHALTMVSCPAKVPLSCPQSAWRVHANSLIRCVSYDSQEKSHLHSMIAVLCYSQAYSQNEKEGMTHIVHSSVLTKIK